MIAAPFTFPDFSRKPIFCLLISLADLYPKLRYIYIMESIGKRIAYLRQKNGFTQQSLAYRLAISRVAISHIEMDLTIPSERSITLMAGIFKLSPMELVQETSYPKAKAERLPKGTTIYTQLELELALLKNDCLWFDQLDNSDSRTV